MEVFAACGLCGLGLVAGIGLGFTVCFNFVAFILGVVAFANQTDLNIVPKVGTILLVCNFLSLITHGMLTVASITSSKKDNASITSTSGAIGFVVFIIQAILYKQIINDPSVKNQIVQDFYHHWVFFNFSFWGLIALVIFLIVLLTVAFCTGNLKITKTKPQDDLEINLVVQPPKK